MSNRSIELEATLRLALEALERIDLWLKTRYSGIGLVGVELEAITAIKEALSTKCVAQPEQEPVVTDWNAVHGLLELVWYRELSADEGLDELQDLIDATPPQRTWVGLDDTDLAVCDTDGVMLAKYWERVLKEKNNGFS